MAEENVIQNEEENEQDNEEDSGDHPLDVLSSAIEDINEQMVRLRSRRAGDLKFELTNNVYPVISKALSSVYDLLYDLDDTVNGESTEEEEEIQMRQVIEQETQKLKTACEKIIKVDTTFPTLATDTNWQDVFKWANGVLNPPKTQVQA